MAITITQKGGSHFSHVVVTFTADGTATLTFPRPVRALSFTSDGVDGGGTLSWKVSNDGTQFDTFAAQTSADPKNATAVTSATAAGNWQTALGLGTYDQYQFILASSTSPTLVLHVYAELL